MHPEVSIRLRPRGTVLSGTVRDNSNGKPVKGITVQYPDVDGKASNSSLLASDGEIHLTLPVDCDPVIIVSARGYKGWVYSDPLNPSHPTLRLGAGERKQLAIILAYPSNSSLDDRNRAALAPCQLSCSPYLIVDLREGHPI